MAKDRTRYRCEGCGHEELRWMGRCSGCGEWNTLAELAGGGEAPRRRDRREGGATPVPISRVEAREHERLPVEPPEFARVLGGGLVPGSLVLLGGAPGVGKSTLLTMIAGQLAAKVGPVVYLTAEESGAQVRGRAERLGALHDDFLLVDQPVLEQLLPTLHRQPPRVLVVDSIQTVVSEEIDGAPGSVSQIRACGSLLSDFARLSGCTVLLIGHVTKDGDLAGPRLLEHLVDTVLYFEPEAGGQVRLLRAFKNRFGATGEMAVLEMAEDGLRPVRDASALFLAGRRGGESGSAVTAVLNGSRAFLVEIQALLARTQYATPARVVTGMESKRVAQLAAILSRKGGMDIHDQDVYVKVAGGLRVQDPSADLAVLAAMVGSVKERPLPADLLVLGEVGLTGELRPVGGLALRLEEAAAHGFARAVVAAPGHGELPAVRGLRCEPVESLRDAMRAAFAGTRAAGSGA